MLLLRNGVYASRINGHKVNLVYKGKNQAELYVDGKFQGICAFDYTKKQIHKIEQNPMYVYNLKHADRILLKELQDPADGEDT
jgi:hypothetical protein